jgi:hypothetical protein
MCYPLRLWPSEVVPMGRTPRFDGRTYLVSGILTWILLCLSSAGSAGQVRLLDLENRLVDPFHAPQQTTQAVGCFIADFLR